METTSSASRSRPTSTTSDREAAGVVIARSCPVARSSTSSEQKPGPIAISIAVGAGAGGRSRRVSSRTCSTEADDRLPMRASESQVSDVVAGDLERLLQRLDDLGAAGVADPPADVLAGQPVLGEELVDVPPM